MRLILREYVALQKESGELDQLVPDLLLAMGIRPLNRPGTGVRQFGVDIPAVGIDPADGVQKLFLITAKQGNITRDVWDSGKDAVYQSLNDILNSYLRHKVEPDHQSLPVRVVLVTGGEIHQTVYTDWVDYTNNHTGTLTRGGITYDVSFDFWGGDMLADLLQRYLVDEYLFPAKAQSVMRRTLALLSDPGFDLAPFEALVAETLDPATLTKTKDRLRAQRFLRLALRVIYRWAKRDGNLRPALLASEFTLLRAWSFFAASSSGKPRPSEVQELAALYETWREVLFAYLDVLRPHMATDHGLFGYSAAEQIEYGLRVYDLLGLLALAGLDEVYLAASYALSNVAASAVEGGTDAATADKAAELAPEIASDPAQPQVRPAAQHESEIAQEATAEPEDQLEDRLRKADTPAQLAASHLANAEVVARRIVAVLAHNPAAKAPPFDEHAIEVALVLSLLTSTGHERLASVWAQELAGRMGFACQQVGSGFPLFRTSHEDLIDVATGASEPEFPASTILPLLAEWAVILDDADLYSRVFMVASEQLPETNLQTWYPSGETEASLYSGPAIDTGLMRISLELPPTLDEFRRHLRAEATLEAEVSPYSADTFGLPILSLLASRRFRTPVRPAFWRTLMMKPSGLCSDVSA